MVACCTDVSKRGGHRVDSSASNVVGKLEPITLPISVPMACVGKCLRFASKSNGQPDTFTLKHDVVNESVIYGHGCEDDLFLMSLA